MSRWMLAVNQFLKTVHIKFYLFFGLCFFILAASNVKEKKSDSPQEETTVTYEKSIRPIMERNCTSCHSPEKHTAGIDLSKYEVVMRYAKWGRLTDRTNNERSPMPPTGLMSIESRQAIKEWIDSGYPRGEVIEDSTIIATADTGYLTSRVVPNDINKEGFELMDLMQGHWVGKMNLMGKKMEWCSFDYRPISASHIHGIYEGGTIGNLFTSFFVTDFNGKRTIMARSGGLINGMDRTSYFVLDEVKIGSRKKCFILVDAYGGKDIMWMELTFQNDKLQFNSYSSVLGQNGKPTIQMQFEATRKHQSISEAVAKKFDYPQNSVDKDFSKGLPTPNWGSEYSEITSASYIHQDAKKSLETLAKLAQDPYTVTEMPYLASLKVYLRQNQEIKDLPLLIYLSEKALTDSKGKFILEQGHINKEIYDGFFSFPTIAENQREFTFNYLHPGDYFITVICDKNKDGYASVGDISSISQAIKVKPKSNAVVEINNILIQN